MRVKLINGKIDISFKYDFNLVSWIKTLDGRQYQVDSKSWSIPIAGALPAVQALAKKGFYIDPEVIEAVKEDKRIAEESESLAVMSDTEFETSLPLYNFQRVGASFLCKIGSGLLGDEPGCGKTPTVISVAVKNNAQKVLVFCPTVLKYQWASELEKFLPGTKVVVIDGSADKRREQWKSEARFYIANYELLLRDFESINCREWDYVFADESTRIQNPSTKQTKAIKKLRSKHRIAMSGTPISNSAQNIWSVLDWCNPGSMDSYWNFTSKYCLKNTWGGIYGYTNMDELREKIKRYMIRRLKKDVLPELPERIDSDIVFVLSEEETELQKKIKKEILYEIAKIDIDKLENPMTLSYTIVKFQRLRQLADSLELLGGNKKSTKLEVLKEKLEEFKDTDQKILIFSEFSEMCKILRRELSEYNPVMIIGDVPNDKRQEILDSFNNDPAKKVCILSSAGQYGLNITSASIVIHYDLSLSLAKLEQRVGRAHRIGAKKNVMVYSLLGKGTADMAIKKIIHKKQSISDTVLGDKPIDMQDIQQMLTYED